MANTEGKSFDEVHEEFITKMWSLYGTKVRKALREGKHYDFDDSKNRPTVKVSTAADASTKAKAEKEVLIDTAFNLFNVRQKDDEDLASYYLRFISAIKLYDRHFGAQISLQNTVQKMKKIFPSKDEKEIQAEEWNLLLAYLFIYRSDQDKYGMFVENLKSQEAMGHK
ncbi:hypothetical protein IV203_007219 [Nitzschia inconspicua]|uniref:Uncharacterized protein n=1 Tax=Nitzschia inconspicua TaxID=303405 RepID=A0A9K3KER7_9STRA|nr:hypothetical protein IV203_007219 [Nitzschia inconspicua]